MIPGRFRRRRSRVSRLLDAPLENIGRVRDSLPATILADVLADLAARTGVELADVADRVLERVGDAVSRAGAEAELLAETDRARQLREFAARAGERAELAYRMGADRLLEAVPERRRSSHKGLILFSAAAGLALGGAIAYFILARPADRRPEEPVESAETGSPEEGGALIDPAPRALERNPANPVEGFFSQLSQRLTRARRAARAAQRTTERRLWHEYRTGGAGEG